jgi:hypothetical protein
MRTWSWRHAVVVSATLWLLAPCIASGAAVRTRFDLSDPLGSPFPSDRFTVADAAQHTGRRIDLPRPDCAARPSDCADFDVINTLDGFNVQPRLSVPFDGPIDVTSVSSETVFLVRLENTRSDPDHGRRDSDHGTSIVGINQVVWDVATNTLYAESDELLGQHTRYGLIVTRGVRDAWGNPVEAAEAFRRFRHDLNAGQAGHDPVLKSYRKALLDTLAAARAMGIAEQDIAAASVFTTQSVTVIVEKIRDQIKRAPLQTADFALGPDGTRAVYTLRSLINVLFVAQTGTEPSFTSLNTTFPGLSVLAPGAVGALAFGKYESPHYLLADQSLPPVGTRVGAPNVQRVNEIFFNLIVPAGTPPPLGWPVAIFCHSAIDLGGLAKQGTMFLVAARLAAQGIATIGINAVGRGFGPLGTLTLVRAGNTPITLPAGGRGIDTDSNGRIEAQEGHVALGARKIIGERDTKIQTVADLMQLVRVIEAGVDVDGDTIPDLDPSRIYYLGRSYGANVGAVFLAVEPSVRAGVLVIPGGPVLEQARLSPLSRASTVGALLAARVPSLINMSGLAFNENLPLRDQPSVINTVSGAVEIQEFFDNQEWVGQGGAVVPYGVYLRRAPLRDVEPKSVIIQFARGDRTTPTPVTTAVLRAGDLADRATYYRFDRFLERHPTMPAFLNDPHGLLITPLPPSVPMPADVRAAATAVVVAAQDQIARFFASDGVETIDPDGLDSLFETPIVPPLPEDAVFFP